MSSGGLGRTLRAPDRRGVAAWTAAAVLTLVLAIVRLRPGLIENSDLIQTFIPAAREIAQGRTPYTVPGYVYSPLVAILLIPLSGSDALAARIWPMLTVALVILACYLFTRLFLHLPSWKRGVHFGVATVTSLYSYPMVIELVWGQVQAVVLLTNVLALLAHARGRNVLSGFSLGLAAVIKSWPGGQLLWLFRRPLRPRLRQWAGVLGASCLAIGLALWVEGGAGVRDMVRVALKASDQPNLAWSVLGIRDLLPEGPGRVVITAVLAAIVLALLAYVLVRPGDRVIAFANLTWVLLLALPVSHYNYLLLDLPVLWWWASVALREPRRRGPLLVCGVLLVWWVISMRVPPLSTPVFVFLVFGATLVAGIVSVVSAGRGEYGATARHPSQPVTEHA